MSFTLSTGNIAYPSASAKLSSNASTSATIKVAAGCYLGNGYVQSTGVVAKIYIDGSLVSTKTILGNGTYYSASAYKEVTASKAFTKQHSKITKSWKVEFHQYTEGVDNGNKQTISGSVSISAKTSYTITYNANGGSNTPSSQTKWYGENLTLSSSTPTRNGYSFLGWGTSSDDTSIDYNPGATFTANTNCSLYAIWKINTYAVTYNANGGSGAPDDQTKTYGEALTISSTIPTRVNYTFVGWSTDASATAAQYSAGGNYTTDSDVTLYAVWELAYWKPKITNADVSRCTSTGTLDDYDTYASVSFDWECCQLIGTNNVKTIKISYKASSDTTWTDITVTASGISGTVEQIVGGSFDIDTTYNFEIEVTDDKNGTTSIEKTIGHSAFPIDILSGGTGVAVGKAATNAGFECAMPTTFEKTISVSGQSTFNGSLHAGGGLTEDIPVLISGDCDSLTTTGKYYIGTSGSNKPGDGLNGWLESKKYSTDYCHQTYTTYTGLIYSRMMSAGTWDSWTQVLYPHSSWNNGKINARRVGQVVWVEVTGTFTGAGSWGSISMGTLPELYRPPITAYSSIVANNIAAVAYMRIDTSGAVTFKGAGGTGLGTASAFMVSSNTYIVD